MTIETVQVEGGFVSLVDKMLSPVDLKVVNSARISMGKSTSKIGEKDNRLINYLAKHEHTTPFRHSYVSFHIKAPIFVLRQWQKHQVGCSWNEISGRYVKFDLEYWTPEQWREQSDSVKQGSGGSVESKLSETVNQAYREAMASAFDSYEAFLAMGVCKEQARACLPLSLYSECYWTASLQAVSHFLKLRLDSHAQIEIQSFAKAVKELVINNIEGGKTVMEALNG